MPHLTHFWHFASPHLPREFWLEYDLAWLEQCDAIVRIPGTSPGADDEMARAKELGLIVLPADDWCYYEEVD